MTDTQRNVGITIVAILLLWWVTKKKKEEVLGTAEAGDDSQGGGGIGGGVFGGGLGIFNITPPAPPVTTTNTTTSQGDTDPKSNVVTGNKNPTGTPADSNMSNVPKANTPTYTYRDGMALRDFRITSTQGIYHNITKGKFLKIADVGGSSTTYPELNPKVSLRMGVDVDYASSATGSIPTGGIAGGLPTNTGIPTGKTPTNTGGVLGGNPNPSGTPIKGSSTGSLPTTSGGAIKL
jgi:hypothetical protein